MLQAGGRFHDGETAKQIRVILTLAPEGLRIVSAEPGNGPVDIWPLHELHHIDMSADDGPARFSRGESGKARLTVDDTAFAAQIQQLSARSGRPRRWRIWAVSTAALAAVCLFLVYAVPPLTGWLATLVPVSWEEDLGDSVTESIRLALEAPEFCSGPAGSAALLALTERLTATVETDYDIRVRVLSHETANAFATVGGEVVLFTGLIEFAESAEEVAAVLAHELAHLVRRHPTQALVRAMGIGLILDLLTGGTAAGEFGQLALTLSYSRDAEREADAVGASMLAQAGIRGDGLSTLFARLEEKEGAAPSVLRYLSTHPTLEERIESAKQWRGGGLAMSPPEWEALQRICE